jgi:S1-C subfamily serine protease
VVKIGRVGYFCAVLACFISFDTALADSEPDDALIINGNRVCESPVGEAARALCARIRSSPKSGMWSLAGGRLSYASRRPQTGIATHSTKLGMTVSEITGDLAQQYRVTQSVAGVMVTEVADGGFADRQGLESGDVLVEIDQDAIVLPEDVERRLDGIAAGEGGSALLLIYRHYEHLFQVISQK